MTTPTERQVTVALPAAARTTQLRGRAPAVTQLDAPLGARTTQLLARAPAVRTLLHEPPPGRTTQLQTGQGPAGPAGQAGVGAPTRWHAFSYGDATPTPLLVVPAGYRVVAVEVAIDIAFDGLGARLSVGTAVDPWVLVDFDDIDPTTVATYVAAPQVVFVLPTPIYLFLTPGSGATRGSGALSVLCE